MDVRRLHSGTADADAGAPDKERPDGMDITAGAPDRGTGTGRAAGPSHRRLQDGRRQLGHRHQVQGVVMEDRLNHTQAATQANRLDACGRVVRIELGGRVRATCGHSGQEAGAQDGPSLCLSPHPEIFQRSPLAFLAA